jgi:predicted small secreted protein
MKKFALLSLAALVLMTSLLGCEMFRGAGQDVKNTANNVENIGR